MTRPLPDYSNPFARNFTKTYTDEHKPNRADLAAWREKAIRLLVIEAACLWRNSPFSSIADFDTDELEDYLHDALSDATTTAWKELDA